MSLHIECENGHKLTCPDSLAGQSVICPKCGSRVDVSARNVARGGLAVSQAAVASVSGLHKQFASAAAQVGKQGQARTSGKTNAAEMTFHCPNGHRLTGPLSLQGQGGECPKCKAKFKVPVLEATSDTARDLAGETAIRTSESVLEPEIPADDDDDISLDEIAQPEVHKAEQPASSQSAQPAHPMARSYDSAAEAPPQSIAHLFALLWGEREHGGTVELHLDGGVVITPDWWATELSNPSHGLFACQLDDGSYEIQAVSWPHVRRVTVKGLKELPGGIFEGT